MAEEAREAALEKAALFKSVHRPLKKWYNDASRRKGLEERLGKFPLFWKDLNTWEGFDDAFRQYQKETETDTAGSGSGSGNGVGARVDGSSPHAPTTEGGEGAKEPSGDAASLDPLPSTSGAGAPAQGAAQGTKKRKRRSRFSSSTPESGSTSGGAGNARVSRRKTRFGSSEIESKHQKIAILRARLSDLQREYIQLPENAKKREAEEGDNVQPVYDSNGKRTNRIIDIMREELLKRRRDVMRELIQVEPSLRGKLDVTIVKKLYIPVKDYPGYNFFGLIIGPRGKTQKEMEAATGVKISIRGKGSVKEGRSSRRDGRADPRTSLST